MKNVPLPLLILCFVSSLLSCNKNKEEIKVTELRLIGIEYKNANNFSRTNLEYDASGRITRITYQQNEIATHTQFDISYANNEIVMAQPAMSNANSDVADTIRLFLDANNRVIKRINHFFFEVKGPANPPQRTYTYDTTLYEYDAAGLPTKEIYTKKDSTWFNNGQVATYFYFTSGVTTYTSSNGNITSSNYSDKMTLTTTLPTNTYTQYRTNTTSKTFQYAKKYPNNTDFSNAAVLRELNVFSDLPFGSYSPYLPNMLTSSSVQKDGNGVIMSTDDFSTTYDFSYNAFRFVSSRVDAESKVKYLYGKP